jgi:arylsulfatase A-like enzyme
LGKLPENRTLLSEQLQRAGYATAAELTNVFLERDRGWTRGFDYYRNEGGADGTNSGNATAQTLTRNGLAWLTLNWRRPYFLWLHYLDPHCPYSSPDTPKELRARYPKHWVARRDRWYYGLKSAPAKRQALFQQFCRDMYTEEVRYVDKWVGELLRGLKASGTYDDSLIVITADHGEELFDHGGMDHGHSLHEEVLHVPLLVKWPRGVTADKVVTHTVPMEFIGGTLLRFAKAPAPNAPDQALPMRNSQAASEVYSEGLLYGPESTALTTDRCKIIYHPYGGSGSDRFEVYDRTSDRRERHNLAGSATAADLRRHLKALSEGADRAAAQAAGDQTGAALSISDAAKRRMRSLGYLGK